MEDKFVNPVRGQEAPGESQKNKTSNGVKITNAIYRILDGLPESDPLKNRVKDKTLAILENLTLIFSAQGWISLQKEKASAIVLDDMQILEKYLTVGRNQGWIDDMNFLIITKEYYNIKQGIEPPKGLIRQSLQVAAVSFKDDAKSDHENQKTNINSVVKSETGHQGPARHKEYSQRQEKILQILDKRQKAQVSDLIKELPKITKRTVRRDLDDLLKRGKIIRVGEWNQVFYQISNRT